MGRLSFGPNPDTFNKLQSAYAESHRHYHTAEHIDCCLELLDEYRKLVMRPDEVELALWFHDAIYRPLSKNNEAKSAAWARNFMAVNSIESQSISRVAELIMATVHQAPATELHAQLLVDIDLSVLGSNGALYRQFEANVRREYKWVPSPIYKRERQRILQSFIDRDTIYSIPDLRDRFEFKARENVEWAIRQLGA